MPEYGESEKVSRLIKETLHTFQEQAFTNGEVGDFCVSLELATREIKSKNFTDMPFTCLSESAPEV